MIEEFARRPPATQLPQELCPSSASIGHGQLDRLGTENVVPAVEDALSLGYRTAARRSDRPGNPAVVAQRLQGHVPGT